MLGATLPGVPLYRSFGVDVESTVMTMPDGVELSILVMARPVDPPESGT